MTKINRAQWTGIGAGLVAASIWGGMYVVSKIVLGVIPPFSLLSMRLILGALILDEKITPLFILGGVMISIGLVIASTTNPESKFGHAE